MISLNSWHLLHIFACILLLTQTYSKDDRKTYIVYMGDHPKGVVQSTELLHISMVQNILGSKFAPDALLHSYKKSFNGFVAKLTEEEAARMAGLDGVVSVFQNKKNKLQTTKSWDFIGFSQNVKRTSIESDIIVGVIDFGIWPESDSFNDKGFGPPPQKWKGTCHNFTCNNKIIGAKYFRMDGSFGEDDIISPRDSNGHGTHCASTAAGNSVESTSFFGLASGTARGGVPSARIAVYKPCWSSGCDDADILQAFDEAIADDVDVISISLGPVSVDHRNYFEDVFAIGAFHAMKKGILTSHSAGNEGPELSTMSVYAPWLLSVAASTTDRKLFTLVQLGDGTVYEGVSVNTFDLKNESYPLIYAGDAPNITGGFNRSISRSCIQNSLDEDLVKGKIVLCDGLIGSRSLGLASGAAGILLRSLASKDVANTFALPAVHLSSNDGALIHSYINLTGNPTATIFKSNEGKDSLAPYIASFSSRGPNPITPNILKPDLAAPGVDILAAWSPISPVAGVKGDERNGNYNIISGTSMACPHVTAAAAYIKSFHPDWSPATIKSALMTTATPMSIALNPEAEFAYGAGQINPIKALNPGLVYDANEIDYVKFLCGQGYDTKKLRSITADNSSCTQANNGTVWDLNLPAAWVLPQRTQNIREVYEVGRKLGQGQFGTTFECTRRASGGKFACKSIPKRKLLCKEDYEDVWREIQIMHHLSEHANVVRIEGTYEDSTAVHLVMELCEGGELFDRIVQKGHYSERQAARLIKTIVEVVEACHSLGVMHRDLKPENFLFDTIDEDAKLKATDFGLSVFYKPGESFCDVVGSPYYVAPEVLRKLYGPESDVWSAGVILYILLSGVPPFWAESEPGIFRQILLGKLDFHSEPWPSISDSAKDLIRKMLDQNPKTRLTAHEVLRHPWIVDDNIAPDKPLDSAVLSRLKQFSAMNKLKKMALRVIAERLSEEEIGGLKELFKMIDTDNSGTITFDELKDGLKRVGSELMESEIKDLMDAADIDKSGTIDYGEFIAATVHLNKLEREENLVSAFSYFDKDGSGYITLDEIQQACKDFGLDDIHIDDMIKEIDQDNDGQIDYGEFAAMMRKGNGGIGRRTMRKTLNLRDALGLVDNGSNQVIEGYFK